MSGVESALAELAGLGIALDAATEVAFRVAWEALPEPIPDHATGGIVKGPVLAVESVEREDAVPLAKRKPGRPKKNP